MAQSYGWSGLQTNNSFVATLVGDRKFLTAFATTRRKHCPSGSRTHALAKTMFVSALGVGGLISAFHDVCGFKVPFRETDGKYTLNLNPRKTSK